MLDMLIRCGAKDKTDFVFFDTGLEYAATKEHLTFLENKYDIQIIRKKPKKSIPTCCREYGVPFFGKLASDYIYRLQNHGFQFEDEPFDVLMRQYPGCKSALKWWCNHRDVDGTTTQFIINRYPYLKEFMVQNNPPKISNKCCEWAKKKPVHDLVRSGAYELQCVGVRKAEGGARSSIKHCFTESAHCNVYRPLFYFTDSDRDVYEKFYGVKHSRCYTEYGLKRTGCFGCPFGKRFEEEIDVVRKYEPKLLTAMENIFGESYEYTRKYLKFREEMKAKE